MFNWKKKRARAKSRKATDKPKTEAPPKRPTLDEVNDDLQRHKQETARRFEENEDRLRTATNSLRQRLNHLDALAEAHSANKE